MDAKSAGAADDRERCIREGQPWKIGEVELILAGKHTDEVLARILGRSVDAVREKKRRIAAIEPAPKIRR